MMVVGSGVEVILYREPVMQSPNFADTHTRNNTVCIVCDRRTSDIAAASVWSRKNIILVMKFDTVTRLFTIKTHCLVQKC